MTHIKFHYWFTCTHCGKAFKMKDLNQQEVPSGTVHYACPECPPSVKPPFRIKRISEVVTE